MGRLVLKYPFSTIFVDAVKNLERKTHNVLAYCIVVEDAAFIISMATRDEWKPVPSGEKHDNYEVYECPAGLARKVLL